MQDDELFDPENWFDYGLTDHIEDTDKFPHWADIGKEMARIAGCEEDSAMEHLFLQTAAAAAKVGFDCGAGCTDLDKANNPECCCYKGLKNASM